MKKNILHLASGSPIRQQLLTEAGITHVVIRQEADESACDWSLPITELVQAIAAFKMEHAVLGQGREGDRSFVLTADTLVQGPEKQLYGKPVDYNDAVRMLQTLRDGIVVATAFCCQRRTSSGGAWHIEKELSEVVATEVAVDISDRWIADYLQKHPAAGKTAGALFVEGYGAQFVKWVRGSYTTVLGLPVYEVRKALEVLGFFGKDFV